MQEVPQNPLRRFLMWWFEPPFSQPYVSASASVDFGAARAYLATLPGVSITHLLAATIGRTYLDFPVANRRISGGRIWQPPSVGVAAPVNLLGSPGGAQMELSLMVLREVERRALLDIAQSGRQDAQAEREGKRSDPFVKWTLRAWQRTPDAIGHRALRVIGRAGREAGHRFWDMAPISTGLTNPGPAFGQRNDILFRGASIQLPTRLVHFGTFWGISAVQDEVVARNGTPTVRPMLPIVFFFDHRLLDGVLAGKVMSRFSEILQDPTAEFGVDGNRVRP